jgi:hypothetical protein
MQKTSEEKNMGRGLANGLLGAIIIMIVFICLIVFNGGSNPTGMGFGDHDVEDHQTNIMFVNQCNTTVNVTVYVLGDDWDKVYFSLNNEEQNFITITWGGHLNEVLVTYNLYDETKAIQYNVNPGEDQIVLLV